MPGAAPERVSSPRADVEAPSSAGERAPSWTPRRVPKRLSPLGATSTPMAIDATPHLDDASRAPPDTDAQNRPR
jgi:hypothetical protein